MGPRVAVAPYVFFPAALGTILLVALTITFPHLADRWFGGVTDWIVGQLGFVFQLTTLAVLIAVVLLPLGPWGTIVLGKPGDKPEFGVVTWLSMLFSAGMGIGLLFFGVAEPLLHFDAPPWGEERTTQAADIAMGVTFFHWGFHAWAVYAIVSLSLAYHGFRRGLPLSIRSCLHPFLGERIHGRWGDLIDLFSVFGTIFGLATSLGLGAKQIGAGLSHLFGIPNGIETQIYLIAFITAAATVSLLTGLKKGMRLLSEVTVGLSLALMLFVMVAGPQDSSRVGADLTSYVHQFFYAATFSEKAGSSEWQAGWTVFYWAWWIAWAPFVGTFVARISRGRTVREFLAGVLVVPVVVTLIWLFVFGETALALERAESGSLLGVVREDTSLSLYVLLEHLPWSGLTSMVGLVCVALFFITSSDSGSFVVDVLTSGGHPSPPIAQRVFWASLEGAVACALLWGGGLRALQSAAIATGLPFALILLVTTVGIFKALRNDSAS